MCMCVLCPCVCVYPSALMHAGQRWVSGVTLHLTIFRQGLSLKLGLAHQLSCATVLARCRPFLLLSSSTGPAVHVSIHSFWHFTESSPQPPQGAELQDRLFLHTSPHTGKQILPEALPRCHWVWTNEWTFLETSCQCG